MSPPWRTVFGLEMAETTTAGKAHGAAKKSTKASAKHLDGLIAEAITDAEQSGGFWP